MPKIALLALLIAVTSCGAIMRAPPTPTQPLAAQPADTAIAKATFAGGCFWCMEPPFEREEGVFAVISGYTGGTKENPTYAEVSAGATGHLESIEVHYDPAKISYERLLEIFWQQVDPTDDGGQFVDRGSSYRTAIFYHDEEQKRLAEESKQKLQASGIYGDKPIITPIRPAGPFYPAEDYHQDYYKENPLKYKFYRSRSGRDDYLRQTWGNKTTAGILEPTMVTNSDRTYRKLSQEELKRMLTPLQYRVTQEGGTEPAFDNTYWDEYRDGIYVDVVSGEPLFGSKDKFDSRTGWPSFTKPLMPDNIVTREDKGIFTSRIEVRSKHSDSHLGHLFDDGPAPTGKRYCMNSAALRFVPKEDLEKEGYGGFRGLFAH